MQTHRPLAKREILNEVLLKLLMRCCDVQYNGDIETDVSKNLVIWGTAMLLGRNFLTLRRVEVPVSSGWSNQSSVLFLAVYP